MRPAKEVARRRATPNCARVRRNAMALMVATLLASACTERSGKPERSEAPAPPSSEPSESPAEDAAKAPSVGPREVKAPAGAHRPHTPLRAPKRDEVERLLRDLEILVKEGAMETGNPWALAHGLVAFGKDMKAADGRDAVDVIVEDYVLRREVAGKPQWLFPPLTPQGEPLEPHEDFVLKSLVGAGVSLNRSFSPKSGGELRLRDLLASAEATFEEPRDAHGWAERAWSVAAILEARPSEQKLELDGWSASPEDLARLTLEGVRRLQAFLEDPMAAGRPDRVEKKKQAIYAHSCGGLHFVQAAVLGASLERDLTNRAMKQLDIVLFRFDAEREIYREMTRKYPEYRLPLQVQELKFYGHILETFGLAVEWGVLQPDETLTRRMHEVTGDLADTIRELESAYGNRKIIRERAPQTYYDLIGDGCHAVRGLRLALAHFFEG